MTLLRDRLKRPCRRAVDRAAMCPDWDYVGKLAFRRQVAGNVPAVCCVVEIAPVNVGNSLHLLSIKIGPQTLRSKTLFRIGRALRLDMNPFKGSSTLYQIPQTAIRG